MWCPPGYISLYEASDIVMELTDVYIASLEIEYGPPAEIGSPDYLEEEFWDDFWQLYKMTSSASERKFAYAKASVFESWAAAAFVGNLQPFVSSPSGQIMRVADELFDHTKLSGNEAWDETLSNPKIRQIVYDVAFLDGDVQPPDFIFFDYPEGIIRGMKPLLAGYGHLNLDDVLHNFDGWAVCFNETDVPTELPELRELIRIKEKLDFCAERKNPMDFIFSCVLNAYPSGKGKATWKEVEERTGYSRRTIQRALSLRDNQNWTSEMVGSGQNRGRPPIAHLPISTKR